MWTSCTACRCTWGGCGRRSHVIIPERPCGCGEIGRRAGFRFQFPRGSVGSSPIIRTNSLLIGSFAVWIYGGVKPEFGGGAPAFIQLYVTPEGAKVLGRNLLRCGWWKRPTTGYTSCGHASKRKLCYYPAVSSGEWSLAERATYRNKRRRLPRLGPWWNCNISVRSGES